MKAKQTDGFGNLILDPITGLAKEDKSQLMLFGNSTATINSGSTVFYIKSSETGTSPLNSIVHSSSTGTITVNLKEDSTLIVAEGKGRNVGGELLSNLTSAGNTHIIPVYTGVAGGSYIPYKATRLPLTIDQNVNLDNPIDAYLKSEFSSSSITVNAGKSITGSGAITSPIKLAKKSKVAIAQKNSTTGVQRNDVILTNNGTISLTGIGMAGIVGEYSEIYNNSVLNTIGDDSTGIITSNGGIATNNGSITVGNNGVGIAGINYLGVGDATYTGGQPTTGNGSIEIVHNGSINSIGTGVSSIGILAKDVNTSAAGNTVTATSPVSITLKNGSSIDVSAAPDSIGVYSDALYRGSVAKISDNGANITIGTDGVGLLAKGTEINATGGNIITVNNVRAQGIFTDSDVVSFKNMTLLGDGSIGIHNYGVNTLYPTNQGRNYVNITNGGTITLGNSASINNPSIGMYTKYGNINHQGTINGGNNVIGILSDTPYAVNNNGTISFGDGAIGIYKKQGSTTLTSEPTAVTMTKLAYTDFVPKTENAWNFADGLEQRYGVEAVGTREKKLFDKLNSIGQNEQVLLTQAYDEMMGHQYGNTQQRINSTGSMLDKEFKHLKKDWRNPSKQNNKIKVFGMRDEYKSDTAGIIDYTSNSYGFAYVHEDERIKMGNSSGWYAGAVTNRFKFKDIGKSKENQTMLKAGVFKTMSPKKDYNGALQWTIGGDVFAGLNNMQRRYLVVDEIFQAKSSYHSYGVAVKTDLGYDIRMSERTHLRPYGALKMEYGRFNDIKEDNGEVRLEVKGNDYFSVKPEVGVEFRYVQPLAVRTNLSVGLTASYENELGKVGDVNNKGRVRYTTADWFKIRGEKDDRRGSGKFDLNIGVDNTRFGVTVNGGYDTKGNNVRGGIGFRAIY